MTARGAIERMEAAMNEFLLARRWEESIDPTGWWMSEKYDGFRACWDGEHFVSRNGNVFLAPAWFRAMLPTVALDGELWLGRGEFRWTGGVVRGGDWCGLRFMVFDAPAAAGVFEERQAAIRDALGAVGAFGLPHVQQVAQERCLGVEHQRLLFAYSRTEKGTRHAHTVA